MSSLERFVNSKSTDGSVPACAILGPMASGDATCTFSDTTYLPPTGQFRITIENERILVTMLVGAVGTLTRGIEQSLPADHPAGASVFTVLTVGALWGLLPHVDVRAYGAVGDGVADDTAAIMAAQLGLPTSGGVVYFPPGTYRVTGMGVWYEHENMIFRGAGMWASTLTTTSTNPAATLVQNTGSGGFFEQANLAFEDLGFDGAGLATNGIVFPQLVRASVRISRCRFYRIGGQALNLQNIRSVMVDDCLFHSAGDAIGTALLITNTVRQLAVRRNRFLWLQNGITIDTGATTGQNEAVTEFLNIEGNHFDQGWWLLTARFSGAVGATYSATGVADAAAAFASIAVNDTVRAMPVRRTGTGSFLGSRLTDAGATFVSTWVRRGDIVRTGTTFGVVMSVFSETVLWVEEWLSDADRLPVVNPVTGDAYTVYGINIGKVTASSATTITVDRWHDLDGNSVTPSAATRYEVLQHHPNYHFNCEYSTRKLRIFNNTFRRGWSDQVSVFGYDAQIIGNTIEDGQDVGITLHGQTNVVHGNVIKHQGAVGIWLSCADSVISDNVLSNTPWVNAVNTIYLSQLLCHGGAMRNLIHGNRALAGTVATPRYGIGVYANADDNVIANNSASGHMTADILVRGGGGTAARTRLYDNIGAVLVDGGATLADQRGLGGAPSASNAGSGAVVAGSDTAGTLTIGSTPGTPTITFKAAWTAAPVVLVMSSANNLVRATSVSATGFTISGTVTAGDVISWMVRGQV